MDELNYLILNYDIPFHITEDVSKRVTDWIASGGNEDDGYIKKYLEVTNQIQGDKDE